MAKFSKTLKLAVILWFIFLALAIGAAFKNAKVQDQEPKHFQFYDTCYAWWQAGPQVEPVTLGTLVLIDPTAGLEVTRIEATIFAYTNRVEETDSTPNITASGKEVREGIIACPVYLPFGTLIEIDDEIYICEDRMAKRYQQENYFDIFLFDLEAAKTFGRQIKTIKIFR